jgi:ribonuclease HI
MADGPHNETDAVYLVASIDHGLPEIKVRRAWKKYQAAALSGDLNRQRKQVHSFAEWVKHKPTAGDAVTNY